MGNVAEALEVLSRTEAVAPGEARVGYARATVLLGLGRRAEARDALERVLRVDPGHGEARRLWEQLRER
jgi:Flp pilus assembly protein TadD